LARRHGRGQGERSQGDQQGTRDPFSVAACPQVQSYGAYSGQKRYTDPDPNVQFALMRQARATHGPATKEIIMSMHHTVRKDGSAVAPLETVAGLA
jgi:hypothetical protein